MIKLKQFIKENAELTPVSGTQYGSNPGGVHVDNAGKKHYVKYYKNPEQAKVEALTGKIYKHMGIHTIEPDHRVINGKSAIVTKWNDNLERMHPKEFESTSEKHAGQLGKLYHAAVLTKNWDAIGLEHDNVMKDKKTGDIHSIDHGGAFHFRAQGGHKDYGPDIGEHKSLVHNTGASGHVFGHMLKNHPNAEKEGLKAVKSIDDDHVHSLFKNSGLNDWSGMHKNFMARKKALIDHYSG